MSLLGALNAGKSALATQQAALQVTGNNIANAGNTDYTRQVSHVTSARDQQIKPGMFIGTGVNLSSIQRQIDEALQGRIRGSISDDASSQTMQQWIGRVESVFNELSDEDLSTQLSQFFGSWSNLANKPQDVGLRQVVLQNGDSLAKWMNNLRGDLTNLQSDVDRQLASLVVTADELAGQVADLNGQIVINEAGGTGQANALRDQRDVVLKRLSELIDIKTVPGDNGIINVFVGSEPLVFNTENRGVALRQETIDGELVTKVIFKANNGVMKLGSGQIGALNRVRAEQIDGVIAEVDRIAAGLIFELNRIHASGQGLEGFDQVIGGNGVDDTAAALNDAKSGLSFTPVNGSFVVHVKEKATGLITSTLVQIDLDGLDGDDTTLASLAADLDGIDNLSANVSGGRLRISADSAAVEFSFSQDSSGVLAALGVNGFFTGKDARDIAVSAAVADRPQRLAASKNGEKGDNQTALAIAGLQEVALRALGGATLTETYEAMVNGVAVQASTAASAAEAAMVVRQTLESQREALSGVSLDEEAINLMRQQRAFQGAARVIAAVDELMRTVLQLV